MIDLGFFGTISFDLAFLSALMSIVIIDLILAGDNAVVIAMAVRSLPHDQRKKGILFGAGAAVLLRVALTFFVAQLLILSYVKLAGGILILWIAVKLFIEGAPEGGPDDFPGVRERRQGARADRGEGPGLRIRGPGIHSRRPQEGRTEMGAVGQGPR